MNDRSGFLASRNSATPRRLCAAAQISAYSTARSGTSSGPSAPIRARSVRRPPSASKYPDLVEIAEARREDEVVDPCAATGERLRCLGVPEQDGGPQRQTVVVDPVGTGAASAQLLDESGLHTGVRRMNGRDEQAQRRRAVPAAVAVADGVRVGAPFEQQPQDVDRVVRRLELTFGLDPVRRHVVQQRLRMRERRAHGDERGLRVQQPAQRADVSRVNGVRCRLEPGVHRVVPVGERVCPVGVPVIIGDGQPRTVDIEMTALCAGHIREAQHIGRHPVTASNCVTQQLDL